MAELRAGALLLVVEKPNLAAEAWFEERQSHGTVSFPSRQLLYASARNRTRDGLKRFDGRLVVPDLSRELYVRSDGARFAVGPDAESLMPTIEGLVETRDQVIVLARRDPGSDANFVRNVFEYDADVDVVTIDNEKLSIDAIWNWVEQLRMEAALSSGTMPKPPTSPVTELHNE